MQHIDAERHKVKQWTDIPKNFTEDHNDLVNWIARWCIINLPVHAKKYILLRFKNVFLYI